MLKLKLLGKVAMVTGGAGGIGQAVCQLFAREGANVGIVDIDKDGMTEVLESLNCDHGNKHCSIEADVSKSCDVEKAFQTIEKELGKECTILINNAGVVGIPAFVGDLEETQIDFLLNVNLKGSILMANAFVKSLKDSEESIRGCLVNISSTAGRSGAAKGSLYCCTKFGVIGLTKVMALEFPRHKIRCNAILPGAIDTPMFWSARHRKTQVIEMIEEMVPMERIGTPKEIADACLFLVSDQSSYVNGATLEVSGGLK